MIRKNLLLCKIFRIKTSSKSLFDSYMAKFQPHLETCPICGSTGNCHIPNDFIPSKKFERIKNPKGFYIAAISKEYILEYINLFDNRPYIAEEIEENITANITPEWFKEKAVEFPTLDQEAEDFRQEFLKKFSVEKLKGLSDIELLETIFLNSKNKTNLCYVLEFDSDCRFIYGSAYKTVDASSLENKDMIFFFTDHISHVAYGKVIGIARERKIPFSYLHGVNMEQIIRQIYESGK